MSSSLNELSKIFKDDLKPRLIKLEDKRKALLKESVTVASILVLVAILLSSFLLIMAGASENSFKLIILLGAGAVSLFHFIMKKKMLVYKEQYKEDAIRPIVKLIDPSLEYFPLDHINQSVFLLSGIIKGKIHKYIGDDLVKGKLGDTALEFSELKVTEMRGSGKNRREVTIFQGLFFIADFNKHFHSFTYVLTDSMDGALNKINNPLQLYEKSRGQLIKLENPQFEKYFSVFTNDPVNARYILSPSLMEKMVILRERTKAKVQFSFIGTSIFIAIPYKKDLFEPRILKTNVDFGMVVEYFMIMKQAISIVEDLQLNTRIWTKE